MKKIILFFVMLLAGCSSPLGFSPHHTSSDLAGKSRRIYTQEATLLTKSADPDEENEWAVKQIKVPSVPNFKASYCMALPDSHSAECFYISLDGKSAFSETVELEEVSI